MKSPIMGAMIGLPKMAPTIDVRARPRCMGFQMSTMPPLARDTDTHPEAAWKKRPTSTVWIFFATSTGIQKIVKRAIPKAMGHLRPSRSDKGPQRGGATTYPIRNKLTPKVATIELVLNSLTMELCPLLKMLLATEVVRQP